MTSCSMRAHSESALTSASTVPPRVQPVHRHLGGGTGQRSGPTDLISTVQARVLRESLVNSARHVLEPKKELTKRVAKLRGVDQVCTLRIENRQRRSSAAALWKTLVMTSEARAGKAPTSNPYAL